MSPTPHEQHLRSILHKRLDQLAEALQHARRSQDVEAVHDLRVASRRLRAFGVTFRELIPDKTRRRLEKKLKRVARAVGPLRDLDVQLELVAGRLGALSSELDRAALEHLLEHLELRRTQGMRRAERRLEAVELDAISRLLNRAARAVIDGLSERDAEAYALSLLEELLADATEQVPPADSPEDPEKLHRLRIDIKELRYALELFEPLLGASFEALHARAVALQEVLGAYHDLVTLAEVVGERSAELRRRKRDALARGLDSAFEALTAERSAVLARFRQQGFDPAGWREVLQPPIAGERSARRR
jgi:CHAD domain-containing protein